jgi:hypothetical protein
MVVDLTNDDDGEWLNVSDQFLADHPWATRSLMGSAYFYDGDPDDDGVCDEAFGIEARDAVELIEAHGATHVVRLWVDEADGYTTGRAARAHLKRLAAIPDEHCVSTLPD